VWPRSDAEPRAIATLAALGTQQAELSQQLTAIAVQQPAQPQITSQAPSVDLEATSAAIETQRHAVEATSAAVEAQRRAIEATMIAATPRFSQVNIEPIANWPFDHLVSPPTGQVSFSGIPFAILTGRKSIFQTPNHLLLDLPTQVSLQTSIARPIAVYILLNGAYVDREFQGRKVGEVNLAFADGSTLNTSLIAYQNVRETWAFKDDSMADSMGAPQAGVQWRNVWIEEQNRGDQPAKAFIDMTTISIPEPYTSSVLISINIQDTSVDTAGSYDPSLVVMAITVESQQAK